MKNKISLLLFFIIQQNLFAQTFKGQIDNYSKQTVFVHKCYKDTLTLVDSIVTDQNGKFNFNLEEQKYAKGMYKVSLQRNQFFYILVDGHTISLKTIYRPDIFYNIATDSLHIIESEENKLFYEFQRIQKPITIAEHWLLQMMRLYPLPDPFHQDIENEYFKRYNALDVFAKKQVKALPTSASTKVVSAYYQPVLPDWKEPDVDRNKVFAAHYFDYFNPTDSLYLHTNILPEKIEGWFALFFDRNLSRPELEKQYTHAADTLLLKIKNKENFNFSLNYILKKLDLEHYETAFLHLYDKYLVTDNASCEPSDEQFRWVREKAGKLRDIQLGKIAPDFEFMNGKGTLYHIKSEYTLLVFWATWCPHCTEVLPKLIEMTDTIDTRRMSKIAISLDTDENEWKTFIQSNKLESWQNTSELKGWNGTISKKYNVYATPTIFLLDSTKRIVAKPDVRELGSMIKLLQSGVRFH